MIRSLQATDHTSLLEVQRRAYQIEAALLNATDFPPLRETIDEIDVEAPIGFVYVIDDDIVGAVTIADGRSPTRRGSAILPSRNRTIFAASRDGATSHKTRHDRCT